MKNKNNRIARKNGPPQSPKWMAAMHISDINPKTAEAIAAADLKDDKPHRVIQRAAAYLNRNGDGRLIYSGLYQRDITLWRDPQSGESRLIFPQEAL